MDTQHTLAELLQSLERELLSLSVHRSDRVGQLLAEDFVEFGSSGRVFRRADILAALRDETPVTITASDFLLHPLGPDAALLTYRTVRHGEPPFHALRSSIWRRDGDAWRMVFHQGTPTAPPA
jgi:hypothetical protein